MVKTDYAQENRSHELVDRHREQNRFPAMQEQVISGLLSHLDIQNSMELDRIHPRVLRELAKELTKTLYRIYHQSCYTGEVPEDWRLTNVVLIYEKDLKQDPEDCRPASLTLVLEKVMEQRILSVITQHTPETGASDPASRGL
ncbi:LINE-1 reverse transcriptase [Pitangus sulphuratus]|nr:LINE-1 reverse transcriptase [Pitangus sulphuratus]